MDDGEIIVFRSRGTAGIVPAKFDDAKIGYLNAMTFEAAKEVCPGWEIYYLEREWLEWMTEEPRNRDARSSASAANGSSDVGRHDRNHRKMFLLNPVRDSSVSRSQNDIRDVPLPVPTLIRNFLGEVGFASA